MLTNHHAEIPFLLFADIYKPTGEILGKGAYASVQTYVNEHTQKQYAVKVGSRNGICKAAFM